MIMQVTQLWKLTPPVLLLALVLLCQSLLVILVVLWDRGIILFTRRVSAAQGYQILAISQQNIVSCLSKKSKN